MPGNSVSAPFMVATVGEVGNEPIPPLSQHLLLRMVFPKAEQRDSGYRVYIHM